MVEARKEAQPLKTSRAIATQLHADSQVARVNAIEHTYETQHSSENVTESHTPNTAKSLCSFTTPKPPIAVRAAWCYDTAEMMTETRQVGTATQ